MFGDDFFVWSVCFNDVNFWVIMVLEEVVYFVCYVDFSEGVLWVWIVN